MSTTRRATATIAGLGTIIAATIAVAGSAHAADKVTTIDPSLTTVNLLNINDFHGRVDASTGPKLACAIVTARTALGADRTALLSAGDNIGASLFVSSSQEDNPTIDYLNALGLKASAVGNHEFDRGFTDLTGRVINRAKFDYLGANVYQRGTTTPALKEYSIQTINGVRVGIIGAVTQETPTLVSPTGVSGLDFGDPVAAVNRVAAQLRDGNPDNGEADIVVAEYHEGAVGAGPLATELAASSVFSHIVKDTSPAVSAIFTAHTHQLYAYDAPTTPGTRPVIQTGSYGANLGQVQLGYNPATKTVSQYTMTNLPVTAAPTAACAADPAYASAKQIVDTAVAQAAVIGNKVVGSIKADITTAYEDAKPVNGTYTGTARDDRMRESALGNLTAQIWLDSLNAPGRSGADIGIMNPGGLRAELLYAPSGAEKPGEVTYAEAAGINPFANTLQTRTLTGAQFKQVLEQQWQPTGAARPFLALGLSNNVTYTYDPARPAGDRVISVSVNGAPIKATGTYRIASSSFLIAGGDNFTVMQSGTDLKDSGLVDTDAFINYVSAKSPIAPSFVKHGVVVTGAPPKLSIFGTTPITVSGLDLTSVGAPANTSVTVTIGKKKMGTFPVTTSHLATVPTADGTTTIRFRLTGSLLLAYLFNSSMTITANPSGTTVVVPLHK